MTIKIIATTVHNEGVPVAWSLWVKEIFQDYHWIVIFILYRQQQKGIWQQILMQNFSVLYACIAHFTSNMVSYENVLGWK